MGHGWPIRSGMTQSLGMVAWPIVRGVYGEFCRTCCVYSTILFASGWATNETEPCSVLPMWSNGTLWPGFSFVSLLGKFGSDRRPLPLLISSVSLSGLTATEVGYHPEGMRPFTTEMRSPYRRTGPSKIVMEMSTTMTALL